MHYQHKQIGTALLVVMAGIFGFVFFMAIEKNADIGWPVFLVLAPVAFLFHSLNINVDSDVISWSFGPGFWRNSLPLEAVDSVSLITTKWYYGLGIRYIPTGWLYTVSGTQAIALKLKDGTTISLGTDDPDNLIAAINSVLKQDH